MTVNKLPSTNIIRWIILRKAEVVAAVHNGLLGLDEACERYRMSAEEFLNWEQLIAAHGLHGLKVTRPPGLGKGPGSLFGSQRK